MAAEKRTPLLARFRGAIQRVSFLLSFDATKWIVVSRLKRSPLGPRPLSFRAAQPSLLDCTEDYYDAGSSFSLSRTASLSSPVSRTTSLSPTVSGILRSTSDAASCGDDVDQRAERFIESFYRRLQMERQVSLELRYCKEKSLERTVSD
ncbi:unnamed protein product [Musa acuminata subsp. malaccensis]|uniref:(wild Malaysian banana) hypothetical protein n=1 Tax=Musa acuminata subsp. malaccensis TaxID=214687 RepID=A0A804JD00_MUSAM|nr:PREDICTED: uncharacterized protein LOC103986901 [Musa acuminata subsp. malaccensis]CAG1845369.1 unnamed protein product [Musa acuminata subsp. malaccensis]